MGTNDKDSVVSRLGAALIQMHGCGNYTPKDVDELEEAAWKALKLLEEQEIVRCNGWRCWTSKPTEEQRKAVKWDEADRR